MLPIIMAFAKGYKVECYYSNDLHPNKNSRGLWRTVTDLVTGADISKYRMVIDDVYVKAEDMIIGEHTNDIVILKHSGAWGDIAEDIRILG